MSSNIPKTPPPLQHPRDEETNVKQLPYQGSVLGDYIVKSHSGVLGGILNIILYIPKLIIQSRRETAQKQDLTERIIQQAKLTEHAKYLAPILKNQTLETLKNLNYLLSEDAEDALDLSEKNVLVDFFRSIVGSKITKEGLQTFTRSIRDLSELSNMRGKVSESKTELLTELKKIIESTKICLKLFEHLDSNNAHFYRLFSILLKNPELRENFYSYIDEAKKLLNDPPKNVNDQSLTNFINIQANCLRYIANLDPIAQSTVNLILWNIANMVMISNTQLFDDAFGNILGHKDFRNISSLQKNEGSSIYTQFTTNFQLPKKNHETVDLNFSIQYEFVNPRTKETHSFIQKFPFNGPVSGKVGKEIIGFIKTLASCENIDEDFDNLYKKLSSEAKNALEKSAGNSKGVKNNIIKYIEDYGTLQTQAYRELSNVKKNQNISQTPLGVMQSASLGNIYQTPDGLSLLPSEIISTVNLWDDFASIRHDLMSNIRENIEAPQNRNEFKESYVTNWFMPARVYNPKESNNYEYTQLSINSKIERRGNVDFLLLSMSLKSARGNAEASREIYYPIPEGKTANGILKEISQSNGFLERDLLLLKADYFRNLLEQSTKE